jgi:hypothetical protein
MAVDRGIAALFGRTCFSGVALVGCQWRLDTGMEDMRGNAGVSRVRGFKKLFNIKDLRW